MMKMTGMIRCEHALELLWEFLDDELPAENETAVRRHLEVCSRCYPQYDFRRAYLAYLRRIREEQRAPSELRSRVFRAILEQERSNGGRSAT